VIQDYGAYRLLIIEDNPGDRLLIEEYLRTNIALAELTWAESLKEAEHELAKARIFDAILLDLTLPDCAGQDLIENILARSQNAPVIVLTGYGNLTFAVSSMGLGISDYLLKEDLDETALYKSIRYSIERKKYVSELEDSEQRYSDLFQMSPQPGWCIDTQIHRFLEVNDAAIAHYGYSREEFLNMCLDDLCQCRCMEQAMGTLEQDNLAENPFEGVFCHYKKDGQRIDAELKSRLIYRRGEWLCLMFVNDVTAQRAYVKNIEQQNEMLQDIVWMQSHEVRAPLARLQGLVQLLQIPDLDGSSAVQDSAVLLAAIQASSEELDDIIRTVVKKTEDVQAHLHQSTFLP
jgi:PAS domain S-box-containing protein